MDNIPYLLALHSIDGLGPIRLKAVLDYFKDPKLAWEANSGELIKIGIPRSIVGLLVETRKKLDPQTYAENIKNVGISYVTIFNENYPKILKEIYDPPVILYYKGDMKDEEKAIAVVGTRKMTGYGKVVTESFVRELASAGVTIVSGLARGVDAQAHKSAIDALGRTVAVLGGGLNQIYPPENSKLAQNIIEGHGALISESPPDYTSLPGNFPARNRIISGLSLAVLVTEAAEDSGSLITARLALEQGREVFAIPGPITSSLSKGPIDLIKEGARVVSEPLEILDELGINRIQNSELRIKNLEDLSTEEKKILEILGNESLHIDDVCRNMKLSASEVSAALLKMEIKGIVQNLGGETYCKV